MKKILTQIPEYLFLLWFLLNSPFRLFAPIFFLFGFFYVFYTYRKIHQRHIPLAVKVPVYLYYAFLAYPIFFLLKITFHLFPYVVMLFISLTFFLLFYKKLSLKGCFILYFVFNGILILHAIGAEEYDLQRYKKALRAEKYARLLISTDPGLPALAYLNKKITKAKEISLRDIFIDQNEDFFYLTTVPRDARNAGYNVVYPALYKVSLKDPSRIKTIHYYYCNNFVYDDKRKLFYLPVRAKPEILVVSSNTFTIKKHLHIPEGRHALGLFLDKEKDRLIAIPEGGVLWIYDLKNNTYRDTGAPFNYYSAGFFDEENKKLYAVSWVGPFLLKEYDTNTLKCTRKITGFLEPAWSLSYDPIRKLFYVPGFFSGKIHVISGTDFRETAALPAEIGVRPVVVDTRRNVLYAGNYRDDFMRVLDYSGKALGKIFVGKRCRSIVISPQTHRVFAGTTIGVLEIDIDSFMKDRGKD